MFDEMESMFLSLTEGYELGITDEMSSEELTQKLEENLSVWNDRISQQSSQWSGFFEIGRRIAYLIHDSIRSEEAEGYSVAKEGTEPLMQWVNYREDSYTLTYVSSHFLPYCA